MASFSFQQSINKSINQSISESIVLLKFDLISHGELLANKIHPRGGGGTQHMHIRGGKSDILGQNIVKSDIFGSKEN